MPVIECPGCAQPYHVTDLSLLNGVRCECGRLIEAEPLDRLAHLIEHGTPDNAPEIARLLGQDVVPSRRDKPIR